MRKVLLVLGLLIALGAAAAAIYWQRSSAMMQAAGPHPDPIQLDVKPGASVRSVLAELDTRGALADRHG
jgi:hypothetical protein